MLVISHWSDSPRGNWDRMRADSVVAELRLAGLPARSLPVIVPGRGNWYRVVMGRYTSPADAESIGVSLLSSGVLPGLNGAALSVVSEGGRGEPRPLRALAVADTADTNRRIEVVR